jgi:hypothetical protein
MAVGTATLAGLLLLVGQAAPDPVPFNQRGFRIPIEFPQPGRRAEIRELILYVSADRGKTWNQEQLVTPDRDHFLFTAPQDGEFWFRVVTVNSQGKQEPENVYNGPPSQRMLIDTRAPVARVVSAQRQGDDIVVAWEAREDHPDLNSLKLEYRTADAPPGVWTAAAVNPTLAGQGRVRVTSPLPVSVRVQLKDTAGNVTVSQPVEVPGIGGLATAGFVPERTNPQAGLSQAGLTGAGSQPEPKTQINTPPVVQKEQAPPPAPIQRERPPTVAQGNLEGPPPAPPAGHAPPPAGHAPPPAPTRAEPEKQAPAREVVARSDAPAPVAAPAGMHHHTPAPAVPTAAEKALPPIQYVNNLQVIVECELAKVGPAGIGNVILYLTTNDGLKWEPFADELKETRHLLKEGPYQRTLQLPGEGLYGFRIVVLNKANLGEPPPSSGDLPEMRVEVDLTPPKVEVFKPKPDTTKRDTIILEWEATDKTLAANPVTLEWSDQRDGPWQTIAKDQPGTGQHPWQPPAGKVWVYLRARVRDAAGNEGVAVTGEPQLVDLSQPVGRLRAVSAVPRGN